MRVAFDIDGVLRDLMSVFVEALNPPRKVEEITSYGSATAGSVIEMAGGVEPFYAILRDHDCWRRAGTHGPILDVCRKVAADGRYAVLLITSNPDFDGQMATLEWLRRHEVPYTELHFCHQKERVDFDCIVEDHPFTAYSAAVGGRAAFIVKRPWTAVREYRHPNLFYLDEDTMAGATILEVLEGRRG